MNRLERQQGDGGDAVIGSPEFSEVGRLAVQEFVTIDESSPLDAETAAIHDPIAVVDFLSAGQRFGTGPCVCPILVITDEAGDILEITQMRQRRVVRIIEEQDNVLHADRPMVAQEPVRLLERLPDRGDDRQRGHGLRSRPTAKLLDEGAQPRPEPCLLTLAEPMSLLQ